jgi:5'-nucleotidase
MKILITNDDGIRAPGIKHLWNSLKPLNSNTYIVAPAIEQSGVGACQTFSRSLQVEPVAWDDGKTLAWSCDGTPADCVKVGTHGLPMSKPDIVVSGINCGSNHGRTVLFSGTVGGAIEALYQGIPSIAFSAFDIDDTDYVSFEGFIPKIITHVTKHPLPPGTLLNVTFPSHRVTKKCGIKGLKLTRQAKQHWVNTLKSNDGKSFYNTGELLQCEEEEDSETSWLARGYVTCCPLHVHELTDRAYLDAKRASFEELFH